MDLLSPSCYHKIHKVFSDDFPTEGKPVENNFFKAIKWSPDGTCLLTSTDDNILRILETSSGIHDEDTSNSQLKFAPFQISEGSPIYDFSWYPLMHSMVPESCCVVLTSKSSPIHLYDCYSGELRASYLAINHLDEITPAFSIAFGSATCYQNCGEACPAKGVYANKIFSGYENCIRIFDVTCPGKESQTMCTAKKSNKKWNSGQRGIISCFDTNEYYSLYAAGCYDKSIGFYDLRTSAISSLIKAHAGGVTQVKFHPNGNFIFSAGRKDDFILCHDIRFPSQSLASLERSSNSNQRISFDIDLTGRYLASGNLDGSVILFDLFTAMQANPLYEDQDSCSQGPISLSNQSFVNISPLHGGNCVSSVHFHPLNSTIIASSSGQRYHSFPSHLYDSDSSESSDSDIHPSSCKPSPHENSVSIWKIN